MSNVARNNQAGLAISFAEEINEAWNNNDAAAVTATYTEDAVLVTDTGLVYGREAIEKYHVDLFKQVHISNQFGKSDGYSPHTQNSARVRGGFANPGINHG